MTRNGKARLSKEQKNKNYPGLPEEGRAMKKRWEREGEGSRRSRQGALNFFRLQGGHITEVGGAFGSAVRMEGTWYEKSGGEEWGAPEK